MADIIEHEKNEKLGREEAAAGGVGGENFRVTTEYHSSRTCVLMIASG